ncbi:MAG: 5'/3'-nucleotidase SurE, partial [Actinobacteria bacterium]|nr:5'/3'-nucleotidase SurE [Actinomycetota bacterium]
MRILVTNDDGIDSIGLHVLARAMRQFGEVVVAAPDQEYSGASAAIGAIHLMQPEVHRRSIDGMSEVWAVSGPPALCVFFARLGLFGAPFDLVVSGINPGANVGRSVYHSGTVGAAITARNGGVTGIAISQAVSGFGVEGQGWDDAIKDQQWDSAAIVAQVAVRGWIESGVTEPAAINVNVPNLPVERIAGWRRTDVGMAIPR